MATNIDFPIDKVLGQIKAHITLYFIGFLGSFNLWFLAIYFLQKDFIDKNGLVITLMTTFALTLVWCLVIIVTAIKELIVFYLTYNVEFDLKKEKTEFAFTNSVRILYGQSVWLVGALLFSFLASIQPFAVAKSFVSEHLLMILMCSQLIYVSSNFFSISTKLEELYTVPSAPAEQQQPVSTTP